MLDDFLEANRSTIVSLARARRASSARADRREDVPEAEPEDGLPMFIEHLIRRLRVDASRPDGVEETAARHAHFRLRTGLDAAYIVHDFGNLCQTVTQLAAEQGASITAHELETLKQWLDDVTAQAVAEHARERERVITAQAAERLAVLAHELRNLLNSATLSFDLLSSKAARPSGDATAAVLGRSLRGLRALVERSFMQVRVECGTQRADRFVLGELLDELAAAARFDADARGLQLITSAFEQDVVVEADRQLLASAITNLLQNAMKFTHPHGRVRLRTRPSAGRVLIEIEDECGGLDTPAEELFRPYGQHGRDRSGLGLGLTIARRAVELSRGEIHVRTLPGRGCVFAIDLPRHLEPTLPTVPPPAPSP